MWIVKLGGSLAADPLLRDWLDMLADCGRGRVVIVPGGGPFADRVREAQQHWDFDDGAAHRMAILAMEQYGHMLVGLCPALTPATGTEQLFAVLKGAGVAVWLPSAMLGAGDAVPQDWSVSSDSLAAWLAQQLSAQALVLVKSCSVPADGASSEELARLGVVDTAFPEFVRRGCFASFVLERTQPDRLRQMLLEWNPATAG
jgi:aspartokinase-like uncharacterized kinase